MHGPGCNTLLKHEASPAQTVGIYLAEAGVIFHSGAPGNPALLPAVLPLAHADPLPPVPAALPGTAALPHSLPQCCPCPPPLPAVMIGLSLGVADGSAFTTLLIALSFHQVTARPPARPPPCCMCSGAACPTAYCRASKLPLPLAAHSRLQFFEGWAIGSAAVDAGISSAKATLLGVVYSLTTPCGIAVGAPAVLAVVQWAAAVGARGSLRAPAPFPCPPQASACTRASTRTPAAPCWPPASWTPSLLVGCMCQGAAERHTPRVSLLHSAEAPPNSHRPPSGPLPPAGILLYVALAQLIPPMLTDSRWLLESRWPLKVRRMGEGRARGNRPAASPATGG